MTLAKSAARRDDEAYRSYISRENARLGSNATHALLTRDMKILDLSRHSELVESLCTRWDSHAMCDAKYSEYKDSARTRFADEAFCSYLKTVLKSLTLPASSVPAIMAAAELADAVPKQLRKASA